MAGFIASWSSLRRDKLTTQELRCSQPHHHHHCNGNVYHLQFLPAWAMGVFLFLKVLVIAGSIIACREVCPFAPDGRQVHLIWPAGADSTRWPRRTRHFQESGARYPVFLFHFAFNEALTTEPIDSAAHTNTYVPHICVPGLCVWADLQEQLRFFFLTRKEDKSEI